MSCIAVVIFTQGGQPRTWFYHHQFLSNVLCMHRQKCRSTRGGGHSSDVQPLQPKLVRLVIPQSDATGSWLSWVLLDTSSSTTPASCNCATTSSGRVVHSLFERSARLSCKSRMNVTTHDMIPQTCQLRVLQPAIHHSTLAQHGVYFEQNLFDVPFTFGTCF
jgi:hypothetical protein